MAKRRRQTNKKDKPESRAVRKGGKRSQNAHQEVITTHVNADFDALASMIAARKLHPSATLVFPGSQEKNIRDFLVHSASYLFNFTKLKQIDFDQIKKLILVDTRQKNRIGKFAELVDKEGVEILIYDHHTDSEDDIHGHSEVVRKIGSTTSMLVGLIQEKQLAVTPDEATIMCLGIHEDTGSFTFSSTTPEDYRAAAWLTEQGANHNTVADMLTREMGAEQLWLLNDLTESATTRVVNGIKVVICKVIRDKYVGDFAVLVHKFMEMENLIVVFAIAQMDDRIYLVARSRINEVNVAEIALALGGGGHPQAASATIKDKTLVQVERSLQALLRSRIKPTQKARDMMTSPVISIAPQETVKKAASMMTRYNINVLLVMDRRGALKGYITRQVAEKASFFGLENLKVNEYMTIEFATVHPNASLKEVQNLIIKNKLRILPVVEEGRVAGVITRTDLLNILVGDPIIPEYLYDPKDGAPFVRKKNMAGILKERLPRKIVKQLEDFGRVADMLGFNAHLVGGLVRDLLLKRENLDVDIVIEGDGIKFASEYSNQHGIRMRSHKKFGTAVLIFPDGFKVDVATARMEYYESPGAPPVIETSSLKMDLYRRDFTINTLAVKLNKKDFGVLIDYFGGQNDIKKKTLRVLHNLSFVEDPTRVFRAIRFEQRFGFSIGKLTLALIRNALKINCFEDLSEQRLFLELKLILKEEDPGKAIERMNEFDLLRFISPEIHLNSSLRGILKEAKKVIDWCNLLYLEEPFEPWKVYWHGLTHALGMEALKTLAKRMGLVDMENRRMINQRVRVNDILDSLFKFHGDNFQLYSMLISCDTETLLFMMAKANSEKIRRLISVFFTKLKGMKVEIKGKDLVSMGFQPSPIFKKIFDYLLEARLNGLVKTKADEIKLVKKTFGKSLSVTDK